MQQILATPSRVAGAGVTIGSILFSKGITMSRTYYVYILTNQYNTVLYTGVTNDLEWRMQEHRSPDNRGFTARYRVQKLVYYETFDDILAAIAREKQLKVGSRQKKIDLIVAVNPWWKDLLPEE
jgi:putative endonuclease